MKNLFLFTVLFTVLSQGISAQGVNQVTIYPVNPSANDTIYVISDFTYHGNCSFGLVYSYSYLAGSVIYILPTYCGYGDTTLCNSIDTFKTGPFPAGNYTVSIEYHQGSICPASGFDATIALFDTSVVIGAPTGLTDEMDDTSLIKIYPNPSSGIIYINKRFNSEDNSSLMIKNMLGETVLILNHIPGELNIEHLPKGVYSILFENDSQQHVFKFIKY